MTGCKRYMDTTAREVPVIKRRLFGSEDCPTRAAGWRSSRRSGAWRIDISGYRMAFSFAPGAALLRPIYSHNEWLLVRSRGLLDDLQGSVRTHE